MNDLVTFVRTTHGLTTTLFGQALLQPTLFTWLQVKAVLLDVLTDAFALYLTAETAKRLFKRLILSNGDEDQGGLQVGPYSKGPEM